MGSKILKLLVPNERVYLRRSVFWANKSLEFFWSDCPEFSRELDHPKYVEATYLGVDMLEGLKYYWFLVDNSQKLAKKIGLTDIGLADSEVLLK